MMRCEESVRQRIISFCAQHPEQAWSANAVVAGLWADESEAHEIDPLTASCLTAADTILRVYRRLRSQGQVAH